jgi:Tc toxin complex TcA C-terminal TcB-binding domain/Neuraminidase-like domain
MAQISPITPQPPRSSVLLSVQGRILDAQGYPLANVAVRAYDRDMRTEQLLGNADPTDAKGAYKVTFSPDRAAIAEYKTPDVFIRVFDKSGKQLGQSESVFNPPAVLVLDYQLGGSLRGVSEYDGLVELISPLAVQQMVPLQDLREDAQHRDFTFLSRETGVAMEHLAMLRNAHLFGNNVSIPPDIYYGLFRLGFPQNLAQLVLIQGADILAGMNKAIAENIISTKWQDQLPQFVQYLDGQAVSRILSGKETSTAKYQAILGIAMKDSRLQQLVTAELLASENAPEKLFARLANLQEFSDGQAIAALKSTLELAEITGFEPALTAHLYGLRTRDPKPLGEFVAQYARGEWRAFIQDLYAQGKITEFPAGITGATDAERIDHYADAIDALAQALYPVQRFAHRLAADSADAFGKQQAAILQLLAQNPKWELGGRVDAQLGNANLGGLSPSPEFRAELKKIARLHKLAPDYAQVRALEVAGLHSAAAISLIGKSALADAVGNALDATQIEAVHSRALTVHQRSIAAVVSHKMGHNIPLSVMKSGGSGAALEADLQALFGADFLCDCTHCSSVYSPAAYFTDILHFLKTQDESAFLRLAGPQGRRPDLQFIDLSCENTNTPLPYIDLVNELLENIAAQGVGSPSGSFQTTRTAAELAAYPEHEIAGTALKLRNSVAGLALPWDPDAAFLREVLGALGTTRQAWMELFLKADARDAYGVAHIAQEILQLLPTDIAVLQGSVPLVGLTHDASVLAVMEELDLSYVELLALLEARYLNPHLGSPSALRIVPKSGADPATCDPASLEVHGLEATGKARFLRFRRLQHKLGWSVIDTDRLLRLAGPQSLDNFSNALLLPLAQIVRLQARWHMPVSKLLGLWAPIDTVRYRDPQTGALLPSEYAQLFQNKQVSHPLDAVFDDLQADPNQRLVAHLPTITAALHLTQADVEALVAAGICGQEVNLANLNTLRSYGLLCRALHISVSQCLALMERTEIAPLGPLSSAAEILRFADALQVVQSLPWSLAELDVVMTQQALPTPTEAQVGTATALLGELRDGLNRIALEFGPVADQEAEDRLRLAQNHFLQEQLATVLVSNGMVIGQMLDAVMVADGSQSYPMRTLLFQFLNRSEITQPQLDGLFALQAAVARVQGMLQKLRISADEFAYFHAHEGDLQLDGIWLPTGNVEWSSMAQMRAILELRHSLASKSAQWYRLWDGVWAETPAAFLEAYAAASGYAAADLLPLLFRNAALDAPGILDIDFPRQFRDARLLLRALACVRAARALGSAVTDLQALANAEPHALAALSPFALGLLKSKYTADDAWLQVITPISNALRVQRRDALLTYILRDPLMDAFRNGHPELAVTDSNRLFEYLLIDPMMDACMVTSRLKQAISTVQLYIDRCLMQLEGAAVLGPDFGQQWATWRNRYRVWEANRKVFLYPENWIYPELRDDKTPFFEELESALRQNEITEEIAQTAIARYLEQLDSVANLQVMALHRESDSGRVHVVGRTHNVPQQYYYRSQERNIWSPWQKIEVDVEGDHLALTSWNGRLYLHWALFTEKQRPSTVVPLPPNNSLAEARKYLEVKLAWSAYGNEGWGSKQQSKSVLSTEQLYVDDIVSPRSLARQTETQPDNNPGGYEVPTGSPTVVQRTFFPADPAQFMLSSAISGDRLGIRLLAWLDRGTHRHRVYQVGTFSFDACNRAPFAIPSAGTGFYYHASDDPQANAQLLVAGQPSVLYGSGVIALVGAPQNTVVFLHAQAGQSLVSELHNIPTRGKLLLAYQDAKHSYLAVSSRMIDDIVVDDPGVGTVATFLSRTKVLPGQDDLGLDELSLEQGLELPIGPKQHRFHFQNFYHPSTCMWLKRLRGDGLRGFYGIATQQQLPTPVFENKFSPTPLVQLPYPVEEIDFSLAGAYGIYNWELFFHIPLRIATQLMENQKFEAARKWFHFIFDPTRSSENGLEDAKRFWVTAPFRAEIDRGILPMADVLQPHDLAAQADLDAQLANWEQHPFSPHAVARLRVAAYMRTTVMKYIDNLIAWGDQLFQRDTLESVNEATLLYVLASNMLGARPAKIPPRLATQVSNFASLSGNLDAFSNAYVQAEDLISPTENAGPENGESSIVLPYFCLPKNDELLRYWDTVDDRLFKLRHCMNIAGEVRQLPLFEPPIDPGLLVRATAAGLDIGTVIQEMQAPLPHYKFQVMLQKANELCNDVKALGSALQGALERKDGEELSLLRSTQELQVLALVRESKRSQRDEAKENLKALLASQRVIEARRDFYASRELKNAYENENVDKMKSALNYQLLQQSTELLASVMYKIPDTTFGFWSWGTTLGGNSLGYASRSLGLAAGAYASYLNVKGSIAGMEGSFQRRQEDWDFQAQSAELELRQMEKQILATEIRLAITEKELEIHDLQQENTRETDDFMRSKFTNQALYDYMARQLSRVYFLSYQLAYQTAKKAEKCYQHELGVAQSGIVQFGYWDSLKKGLLAGDKLQYALRQLEMAYLDRNVREMELTKHVSLALLDPLALLALRTQGACSFTIPEALYDMDFAGQYFRRIKSVSMTLPCVAGPYTSISVRLKLVQSAYRTTADANAALVDGQGGPQSIAISSSQNDSGVFEVNFRDERYLPFEGCGAVSTWSLELPSAVHQFDYATISDAIFHVKYTAREGGDTFKTDVQNGLLDQLQLLEREMNAAQKGLFLAFNLRYDMPNEFHLLKMTGSATLRIDRGRLPYFAQGIVGLQVEGILLTQTADVSMGIGGAAVQAMAWDATLGLFRLDLPVYLGAPLALTVVDDGENPLQDLILVVQYAWGETHV